VAANVLIPDQSTATACFNDTCVVGVLVVGTPMSGSGVGILFPAASGVSGVVWAAGTNRDRVEINWQFTDLVRFDAGDRYHVTVTDPGGVTIATKEVTAVSYDTYEPNGPSCGPTCHRARFP
jgi:hypothetical protein